MNQPKKVLQLGLVFLLVLCFTTVQSGRTAYGAEKINTTLENLQTAYNGESNAHVRYLEFAKKAQDEGYLKVAALFRATAKSEEIHANNHAKVIKKMGGVPKANIETPKVGTTKENLARLYRVSG